MLLKIEVCNGRQNLKVFSRALFPTKGSALCNPEELHVDVEIGIYSQGSVVENIWQWLAWWN